MIEMIINRCLKNQLLVMVNYQSPFYITQNIIGQIIEVNKDKQQIRLHMYDYKTKTPLFDDTAAMQMITIAYTYINYLQPLFWTKATTTFKPFTLNELMQHFSDELYRFEFPLLKINNPLDKKQLSSSVGIFKNILSVEHKKKIIPIISNQIIYDYDTNTFIETDAYIHNEDTLKKVFKFTPDFSSISSIKHSLKPAFKLNEEPYVFTLKSVLNKHVLRLLEQRPTRPIKAYINTLKLTNLGRKNYLLPSIKFRNSLLYEQTISTLFSDPMSVTVFDKIESQFIEQLYESVLINNTNTLIIGNMNDSFTSKYPVLKLDDYHAVNQALDYYKETEILDLKKPVLKPISKEKFNKSLVKANAFSDLYTLTSRLLSIAHYKSAFDFSIQLESYIDTLLKHPVIVPIDYLTKKYSQNSAVEDNIQYYHSQNLKKLNLKAYKLIKNLINMSPSQRRKNLLLQYVKQPRTLALLKQMFPLIIANQSQSKLFNYKCFETLVLVDPGIKDAYKLFYTDKALIIDTVYKTEPMVDNPLSSYLLEHNNPAIHFQMESNEWVSPYKSVVNQAYKNRLKALDKTLDSVGINIDLKTPFLKEKKLLNTRYKNINAETFYNPTRKFNTVVSLGINQTTIQKAYDWIKQHPDLLAHLAIKSLTVHVDIEAVKRLSDGQDPLIKWIDYYYEDTRLTSANNLITSIVNACLSSPKYLETDIRFERIFKHLKGIEIKRINYVLWRDDGNPDIVVMTYRHFKDKATIETLSHYAQRQGFDIFIIKPIYNLFLQTLFDILIATQKCKRW